MLEDYIRSHILALESYTSARDDFSGDADVYLDANENWMDFSHEGKNRYPDPHASALREKIEEVMGFKSENTVIGNGSDELIDMLIRIFASPGKDTILIERPTYGEYKVFAEINDVGVVNVPLTEDLDLDVDAIKKAIDDKRPKIVFICSPNNPTGKVYPLEKILRIAEVNDGITAVDEAYADFSEGFKSAIQTIKENPRIVVLRTFSKAYGKAGARLGILVSDPAVQKVFMKAKPPYNVSSLSEKAGLEALRDYESVRRRIEETIRRRKELSAFLRSLPYVSEVFPSEANFVLVRVSDAASLYSYLLEKGIVVRNRSSDPLLENTLRITIGSEAEMAELKEAMNGWNG